MIRFKVFAYQVYNPIMELVVTRHEKAAPLAVEGMAYGKIGVAAVVVFGGVWGI